MTFDRELSVLYRGPLSSCNYGCHYCPFAKHKESDEEHAHDAEALGRFVDWCEAWPGKLSVFFTPWGEALVQRRYQEALARLSRFAHLRRVAIQTNLSPRLDFLDAIELDKLGIWATYHPQWVQRERFINRCLQLHRRGVSFSVGVVGFPEFKSELVALREALPNDVYVWVNAVKPMAEQYSADDLATFERIDKLFPLNLRAHPSRGRACAGGHTVISVDGEGTARSCHFVREPLGNIYERDFEQVLKPRVCPAETCGCHIGYVHLSHLGLGKVFGEGILERNPFQRPS